MIKPHNSAQCASEAMRYAEEKARLNGLKLTPARRFVLGLLLKEHRAFGAYEILDRLRDEGLGSQPPIVYRALEFLVDAGFAHRIGQLNAFVACCHAGNKHMPVFLICENCRGVQEQGDAVLEQGIMTQAEALGFQPISGATEIIGLCGFCREAETK